MAKVSVVIGLSACNTLATLGGETSVVSCEPAVRWEDEDNSPAARPSDMLERYLRSGGFDALLERVRDMQREVGVVPMHVRVIGSSGMVQRQWAAEIVDLLRPPGLPRELVVSGINKQADAYVAMAARHQMEKLSDLATEIALHITETHQMFVGAGFDKFVQPVIPCTVTFTEETKAVGGAA